MLKFEGVRKWTKSKISKSTHNVTRKLCTIVQIDWIISILYFEVRGRQFFVRGGVKAMTAKIEFITITQKVLNRS